MILVADSGSTKCDWALLSSSGEVQFFKTMGFNPFYHDKELIVKELNKSIIVQKQAKEVTKIYFYGAGNSSSLLQEKIKSALTAVFPFANEILSSHDVKGAAIATYTGEPCITCILGTGSNSCYFDGHDTREEVPALSYILGDEASGSYFGKQLLAKYLYKQLPSHLQQAFFEQYNIGKEEIFENTYMKAGANVYLASFMPFFNTHKKEAFIQEMLSEGFRRFLKTHVMCFEDYATVPVHFIGSIAHFFEKELRQEAHKLNIKVGNIIRRPIDGLVDAHRASAAGMK